MYALAYSHSVSSRVTVETSTLGTTASTATATAVTTSAAGLCV